MIYLYEQSRQSDICCIINILLSIPLQGNIPEKQWLEHKMQYGKMEEKCKHS